MPEVLSGAVPTPPDPRVVDWERQVAGLTAEVAALTAENAKLTLTAAGLRAEGTRPTPAELVAAFATALQAVQARLAGEAGGGVAYTVSTLDVVLKTQVTVDGETVRLGLPSPGQVVVPEALSTIRFVVGAIPLPPSATAGEATAVG